MLGNVDRIDVEGFAEINARWFAMVRGGGNLEKADEVPQELPADRLIPRVARTQWLSFPPPVEDEAVRLNLD